MRGAVGFEGCLSLGGGAGRGEVGVDVDPREGEDCGELSVLLGGVDLVLEWWTYGLTTLRTADGQRHPTFLGDSRDVVARDG